MTKVQGNIAHVGKNSLTGSNSATPVDAKKKSKVRRRSNGQGLSYAKSEELSQLKLWQNGPYQPKVPRMPKTPRSVKTRVFSLDPSRTSRSAPPAPGRAAKNIKPASEPSDSKNNKSDTERLEENRIEIPKRQKNEITEAERTTAIRQGVIRLHDLQTKVANLEAIASDCRARASKSGQELTIIHRNLDRTFAELRETLLHDKHRKARLTLEAELLNARQGLFLQRVAVARKEAREADLSLLEARRRLRLVICHQDELREAQRVEKLTKPSSTKKLDFLKMRDSRYKDAVQIQQQATLNALFRKLKFQGPSYSS